MSQPIDHLVVVVASLAQAEAEYTALGFTVTPGGAHAGGDTGNALVAFQDGTYLELLAFLEPGRPSAHRWRKWFDAGGGLVDVCFRTPSLADAVSRAVAAGVAYVGPTPGQRTRPDGQSVEWLLAHPPEDSPGALPFVIEDRTPRSLRVPHGDAALHANGATGIAALALPARDPAAAARCLAALSGGAQEPGSTRIVCEQGATILVGSETGLPPRGFAAWLHGPAGSAGRIASGALQSPLAWAEA